jgi:hypothetical protein
MEEFSLNSRLLRTVLSEAKPLGHDEQADGLNLGFGFVYYGFVRAFRPKHVLVIGSGHGFSVVCLALGVRDNAMGRVTFVDPSYSLLKNGPFSAPLPRGDRENDKAVLEHFSKFGVQDIVTHYRMRSEELSSSYKALKLPQIDLAFIDASHAFEDVRFDFIRVLEHCRKDSYVFLHASNIYVREMLRHAGVNKWTRIVKREDTAFEVINFPFSSGVVLVRVIAPKAWRELN